MQKIYNVVVKGGDIVGFLISIGALVSDFFGWIENPIWLYIIGFILLVVSHFWLKVNFTYARPKIRLRRTYLKSYTLRPSPKGATTTTTPKTYIYRTQMLNTTTAPEGTLERLDKEKSKEDIYDFALIEVRNKPKIKTELSNAKNVVAETYFFDRQEQQIINEGIIYARWWDETEVPSGGEARRTLRSTEIPANNEVRTLAIALSHIKESKIFAYGVDSLPKKEWRNSDYFLNNEEVIAIVVIKGDNMENVKMAFSLSVNEDNRMDFELIDTLLKIAKDVGDA